MFQICHSKALLAILALVVCTGVAGAAPTIAANPSALTLHCDQGTGPTPGTVGITLVTTGAAVNVTVTSSSGAVVLPSPAVQPVSSTTVATQYSFTMASACAGATNNQQVTLTFTPATGTGLTVVATLLVTVPTIAASQNSIALSCDTVFGPAPPVTIGLTQVATGSAINVTAAVATALAAPTGPIVLPGSVTQSVNSTTVPVTYSFSMAAGCKGFVPGTTPASFTVTFTPTGGTGGISLAGTMTVTNSASALAASPSAVTITCLKSGSSYTPGAAQTVNVTSPANGGTPFTVDNTTNPLPSWLAVTPLLGGTASGLPVALSVVAKSGCGGLGVGSTSFSVHLLNAPAPDRLLAVTIQVGAANTLSSSVNPVALSFTSGSTTYTPVSPNLSSSPAVFFSVDPTTIPLWLTVSPMSGTTTSPVAVSFTPTAGAQTLALGGYTANVHMKVSGELDFVLPVNLQVKNPAPTLTVAEGLTRTINWTLGTALPSLLITPVSSDSPIAYSVTTTPGTLYPQVSATSGLAYSFGSPLTVSFLQSVFGAAAPGAALTGSVIVTPAGGSAVTVALTVNVKSPGAAITLLSPPALPTATSGTFNLVISGSGFVASSDPTLVTRVGVVTGGLIVSDANVVATVINSTSIDVVITVPSTADPYLPFSGNGGSVLIGVCNPQGVACSTPTGPTPTLTIGINPIVQAVTSAASFTEATPPALVTVAPYDILSIFGTNFCVNNGTGCTGGNSVLYGQIDPVTLRYLTTLSPDASGPTQRSIAVTFQTHTASPTAIATGALLFAANNQINVAVPDAVKAYIGSTVDIVVSFGYGSIPATMLKSAPYSVTVGATDPGVFTVGGDGQGDAAALSPTYALITNAAPAVARISTDSDVVALYVAGLGRPDSDGTGTGYSATCMPTDGYWAAVNAATSVSPALTSDDGVVLQPSLFPNGQIQPCIKAASPDVPAVTVGAVTAPVKFAGWVAGSIAGLYQINVQLPVPTSSFTDASGATGAATATPIHLPVVVTAFGRSSQLSGVNLWVARGLVVTPSGATTGTHSTAWAGSAVLATDGSGTYSYAVTTGILPDGLVLNADGTITGTLAADAATETFTVTATDTGSGASAGCTGTVSITYTIN